jgi:hypothetical protein
MIDPPRVEVAEAITKMPSSRYPSHDGADRGHGLTAKRRSSNWLGGRSSQNRDGEEMGHLSDARQGQILGKKIRWSLLRQPEQQS